METEIGKIPYLMNHPYIDRIIESCQHAKAALPTRQYEIGNLLEIDLLDGLGNAIYIIREVEGDIKQTFSSFENYKSKKERACARLNKPSEVLYVGSSITGIKTRLKQHLYEGPKGTYALHMKNWFSGQYIVEVIEYDVPIQVLQIIEDFISFNLNPAFGKRGGNKG